jgi:hypothetical protein
MAAMEESCCYSIERWMMRTLLIVFLFTSALVAERPRDDWKLKPFDWESHLTHSLAEAPLTANERDQIYRIVDEDVHDSFGDAERAEERKAVMSFRVGSVALARNGSEQILVRGTGAFCGGTGNCSMWIFVRHDPELRLALGTEGQVLIVRNSFTQGFHDIAVGLHDSAFMMDYTVYRWDSFTYKQADCYAAIFPIDGGSSIPAIKGCR